MDACWLFKQYVVKGLSAETIGKDIGCCKATVLKRLRQHHIPLRPPGVERVALSKELLADLYMRKKWSARRIAAHTGCGATTVFRHLERYGISTRDLSDAHMKYPRKPFCGNRLQRAYMAGFAIGDLRVRKVGTQSKTIKADCGSTKEEQIHLIKSLFDGYGRVWTSNPSPSGKVQIEAFLDESFAFLLTARDDVKQYLDGASFLPFLAGFADAEGCFGITHKRAYFSLGNYDVALLRSLREELMKRGIAVSKVYCHNKLYISRDGYRRNNYYYHWCIRRKSALMAFIKEIGPFIRHEGKKERLLLAKNNLLERGL